MENLQNMVEGYIKSHDYKMLDCREGFMVADKLFLGGEHDTWLIWITPPSVAVKNFNALEKRLLDDFDNMSAIYPKARYSIVAFSREGFSRDFLAEIRRLGVRLRVPIQFFDTPFKHEEAPGSASIIKTLIDSEATVRRVRQPYSLIMDGEAKDGGEDLLSELLEEVKNGQGEASEVPCLRVIVGAAGIGKSVLFQHFFRKLYSHFQDQKSRQKIFMRPIPLLPEYLHREFSLRTKTLISNFLRTDVANPVPNDTFEWMLCNGLSMWLFDGLDELYSGDPDFFQDLLRLLTNPPGKAQILVCVRKSLLRTCEGFANLLDEFGAGPKNVIRVYELNDWDYASKRMFAWLSLEVRLPTKGEKDTSKVSGFLNAITKSKSLKLLSNLPYYCDLLMDEYLQGALTDFSDDYTLIRHAISGITEREQKKGLLSLDDFEREGLDQWMETIALEVYSGEFKSIEKSSVKEYAELVLRSDLSAATKKNAITRLVLFPLFAPGIKPGTIAFKHELVVEYLTGRYLLKRIEEDPEWAARILGTRNDFADSLIARYMASQLAERKGALQCIITTLKTKGLPGMIFTNLLQLLLLSTPARDVVRSNAISLEGKQLKSIVFKDKDLDEVSFRNCDLSNATFEDCSLKDAFFEGAILLDTRFNNMKTDALKGAKFGNLNRFNSIYYGRQRMESPRKAREWAHRVTGLKEEIEETCPAALRLRQIFLKFVHPDGTWRRDEILKQAIVRGKKFPGAPSIDDCIKACLRFDYLEDLDYRSRYKRAHGDLYNDIVQFVKDWQMSQQMKQLLNSLCSKPGCKHVPFDN